MTIDLFHYAWVLDSISHCWSSEITRSQRPSAHVRILSKSLLDEVIVGRILQEEAVRQIKEPWFLIAPNSSFGYVRRAPGSSRHAHLHRKSRALIPMSGESVALSSGSQEAPSDFLWIECIFIPFLAVAMVHVLLSTGPTYAKISLAPTVASCMNPRTLKCILREKKSLWSRSARHKGGSRRRDRLPVTGCRKQRELCFLFIKP